MSSPAATTLESSRLGRSQAARRARVIEAVLELAAEGGYEAVQVRPLSDRTGVGSDTIYRYFGSRDRLVSEAVVLWLEREFVVPAASWVVGDTPAERLLALSRRVWHMWERNPNMLATMVHASLLEGSGDEGVTARTLEVGREILERALDGVEDDYRHDVIMIMETTTRGAMHAAVHGSLPIGEVYAVVERTIRRLAQHPAMDGHRPRSWDYAPGSRS